MAPQIINFHYTEDESHFDKLQFSFNHSLSRHCQFNYEIYAAVKHMPFLDVRGQECSGDQNAIRPSEQQQQQLSTYNFITGKSEGK